ncbi:MAG TPA: hypothetical protein VGJ93_06030 [Desulfuromonadaceae bacterium]|jgi:hypothetical protein
MHDENLKRLLQRFTVAAKAHNQALEEIDEEEANAHARIIAGLHAAIIRKGSAGQDGLLNLVDDKDPVVAGMAAVFSLRYNSERSLTALRLIARQPGLLGFRASVAIERWEAGELNVGDE